MHRTVVSTQLLRVAVLSAVYAAFGLLAVALAVPPGFSAPIYPSAGIALAATLVFGPRIAVGVFIGSFAVNEALMLRSGAPLSTFPWLPLVSGIGAALQAVLGAALVRRRQPDALRLSEPREVMWFFVAGGALACLLNATLSNLTMGLLGLVAPQDRAFNWWSWWSGDTLGVLIATPVTLSLIGQPRADWAGRRTSVALPLLGATALLALTTALVTRWDGQRLRSVFERDANAAAEALGDRLHAAQFALASLRGLLDADEHLSAEGLRRAAAAWSPAGLQIQALGFAQRVPRDGVAAYEREVRDRDGRPAFRVFDRPDLPAATLAADPDKLVIRFVEPFAANAAALGVNVLSAAAARPAALQSIVTDDAVATAGFRITQETADQTGIVVYRPVFRGAQPQGRPADNWLGVVFVTLRMQQATESAMAEAAPYLHWCLHDLDPGGGRPLLAKSPGWNGCGQATDGPLALVRDVGFAGRQWRLALYADRATMNDDGNGNAWLFSSIGLVSTGMLAALLLTVTGRARRIEAAVAERTGDLQREIAERQRADAALRQSEQRFRNVFDQAPLGIAYTDLRGHVRESNPRLRAMLGHDPDTLAERPLTDFAPPDERAAEADALAALLRDEPATTSRRLRLRHHDGQYLWVQMNWSVLRDALGRPLRLVAVLEDITDHLKREEAEQGRQVAESANRAKNEFLSRMSHELRTPLNAMLGFSQLLDLDRQPPLAPHQAGWNGHILQAGWHLLEMINDILDLSRIEAGMLRLDPSAVPLAPLINHCLAMVAQAADRRGIQVDLAIDPDATLALGDETRIKQVLTNLLSNAVKYNVEGGVVRVRVRRIDDAHLQILVQDTGPGLTPAQRLHLFQPFNRLGREQGGVEGTGIGLVISRRLAEWMGGGIDLLPTAPGEAGATFVFTLPLATAAARGPQAGASAEGGADTYRRRQVLYIEDNETNAEVMRGILDQRPQVHLTVAATGEDGMQALRRQRPDLVLMDMHLPDADGLDLLRALRADPLLHDLPVLVVSADATPARVDQALAAGALHYLTKPLNVGAFLSVLDQVLDDIDTAFGDLGPA